MESSKVFFSWLMLEQQCGNIEDAMLGGFLPFLNGVIAVMNPYEWMCHNNEWLAVM